MVFTNLAPGVLALDDLIAHYQKEKLIAYPEMVRKIGHKIRNIPENIPHEEIKRNVALLSIWPLIEAYSIAETSIYKDIDKDDRDKLNELIKKFYQLKASPDMGMVKENAIFCEDYWDVNYMNPYSIPKEEFLGDVLSVMCEPLENHVNRTRQGRMKLIHDAQMGGSIYVVGNDGNFGRIFHLEDRGSITKEMKATYSFLQRSFICVDKDDEPFIFIDNIEGGQPFYNKLDHWRGMSERLGMQISKNRIHHVYLALASTMYVAEMLDLNKIVPRDYELTEFARTIGLREKRLFSKDQEFWKIGLHSKKNKTGVYTHSLYRGKEKNQEGHQLRFSTMKLFPYKNSSTMLDRLNLLGEVMINDNKGRTKNIASRTDQRLNAFNILYEMVEHFPLSSPDKKHRAREMAQKVYHVLKPLGRDIPPGLLPTIYER